MIITQKPSLKFNNGKFRILVVSDLHGGVDYNRQLDAAMEAIVQSTSPDLVLIGGDTSGPGKNTHSLEELRILLDGITAPMEKRGIAWAHVFGNHDDNGGVPNEEQEPVYESYPHCVSQRGPEDIHGVANYVLPVMSSDGKKIAYNVWGLDSHDNMQGFSRAYGLPEDTQYVLPEHFCLGRGYDTIHFDQIMWYYRTSLEMERKNGARIPALMYFHIPLPEFVLVYNNREECGFEGTAREEVGCGELNSGLFSVCLQRGDVKAIVCGHDHISDFKGEYCGITLAYDAGMDYDCYQHDDLRGGRVFEIDEANPDKFNTYIVRIRDIMGAAGDKVAQ